MPQLLSSSLPSWKSVPLQTLPGGGRGKGEPPRNRSPESAPKAADNPTGIGLGFAVHTELIPAGSQHPLLMPAPRRLAYSRSLFAWLFAASFSLLTPLWMHIPSTPALFCNLFPHTLPSPKNPRTIKCDFASLPPRLPHRMRHLSGGK